jgi:hypothetical protein
LKYSGADPTRQFTAPISNPNIHQSIHSIPFNLSFLSPLSRQLVPP